jgi:LacI family transcriptional regulator
MAVTIRDVARQAGVGVATVSRVINHSELVSGATREAVVKAIAELNYTPNPTARRLSLGRTFTLGVITPFFTRYSYTERLRAIEHLASRSGYDIIVFNVDSVERRNRHFLEVPRPDRVDGVIVMSLAPTDEEAALFNAGSVPVVLVDTVHPLIASIFEDSIHGGRAATRHLIDLGHRRIGFIADTFENPYRFTSMQHRHIGYVEAMQTAGLTAEPGLTLLGEHGQEAAQQMAHTLLARPDRPSAIVAASDTHAMGVLKAASALGLRVPHDLSVIGYDDIEVAEYLGLSTMRQSLFESGRLGVEMLLAQITDGRGAGELKHTRLLSELVIRSTTTAPAG